MKIFKAKYFFAFGSWQVGALFMRSAVAAREPSAERKMFLLSLTPGLRRGYVHSVPSGLGQFTFKGSWLEKRKALTRAPSHALGRARVIKNSLRHG